MAPSLPDSLALDEIVGLAAGAAIDQEHAYFAFWECPFEVFFEVDGGLLAFAAVRDPELSVWNGVSQFVRHFSPSLAPPL